MKNKKMDFDSVEFVRQFQVFYSRSARTQDTLYEESSLASYPWGMVRTVTRVLIWGGGGVFIYLCFARQISFQIDQFEFDLEGNSSGRT